MIKRFNIILPLTLSIICLLLLACTGQVDNNQQVRKIDKRQMKKSLEEANRDLALEEMAAIDDYIVKHNLNMVKTGTGLCYNIERQGDKDLIKTGDLVSLDYEMRFLNKDEIVSDSKNDGLKTFLVGHGGVEIGLEEAILHLHKGDEAEIIIPSHLAHGLIGDGERIPPRTTIVYKVKIVENQSNN